MHNLIRFLFANLLFCIIFAVRFVDDVIYIGLLNSILYNKNKAKYEK